MKVCITLDVPDAIRRCLNRRDGRKGMATRKDILKEHDAVWFTHMQDIASDGAAPLEDEIEEQ